MGFKGWLPGMVSRFERCSPPTHADFGFFFILSLFFAWSSNGLTPALLSTTTIYSRVECEHTCAKRECDQMGTRTPSQQGGKKSIRHQVASEIAEQKQLTIKEEKVKTNVISAIEPETKRTFEGCTWMGQESACLRTRTMHKCVWICEYEWDDSQTSKLSAI